MSAIDDKILAINKFCDDHQIKGKPGAIKALTILAGAKKSNTNPKGKKS